MEQNNLKLIYAICCLVALCVCGSIILALFKDKYDATQVLILVATNAFSLFSSSPLDKK